MPGPLSVGAASTPPERMRAHQTVRERSVRLVSVSLRRAPTVHRPVSGDVTGCAGLFGSTSKAPGR